MSASLSTPELSVVVPAYNEAGNVEPLLERLSAALAGCASSHEIILVDDASEDDTFATAKLLRNRFPALRILRFSRNFGHQAALLAGLRAARGQAVITMDADLQHPPEVIPALVREWRAGHLVVHAQRDDKKARIGLFKRLSSRLFYRIFSRLSRLPLRPGMADFRLIDRQALEPVLKTRETRLFLRGMFVWVGYPQAFVPYAPDVRRIGRTTYSTRRMVRFGGQAILAFSERPLYWSFFIGLLIFVLSLAYGVYAMGIYFFTDTAVPGWTSLAVLVAFLMGTQFILIGLVGAYVAAIYSEIKRRPPYVIAEELEALVADESLEEAPDAPDKVVVEADTGVPVSNAGDTA